MKRPLCFVNLISYNFTSQLAPGIFTPSSPLEIKKFKEVLEYEGIAVTQRHGFGQDVEGACGQLATKDKE